ncbi:uncharacterized protein LOC134683816 [Mytilus trossulus]|uniref:uncharacterized protein LOC134683816 n=1 Tax=Mytilus trossulus TaxID=6551 RepID=UPI003004895E
MWYEVLKLCRTFFIHTHFLKFLMMDSYVLILMVVSLLFSQKAESHNGNIKNMHYDFFDSGCGKLRYVNLDTTYQVECTNRYCFGKHDSCLLPFTGSNSIDIVCAQVIELRCRGQIILRIDYRGGYNGTGFKEYHCLREVDENEKYCGKYIHIVSFQKPIANMHEAVDSSIKVWITAYRSDEIKMSSKTNPNVNSVILYTFVTLLLVILVIVGVFWCHRSRRQRRNTTDPVNLSYQNNYVAAQNHLRTPTNVSVRYGVVPNEYVDLEGVTHQQHRPHESSSTPSPVQSETDQQSPDHDMYVELSVDLNSDTRRGAAAYQTIWD